LAAAPPHYHHRVTELYAAVLVVGALVLGLGLLSGIIQERLPVTSPLLSLLAGVLLGPVGLGVFDAARWGQPSVLLGEGSRLTLAIGLMAAALRLPPRYFLQHWRLQLLLLGVLMPIMWIAATAIVYVWLGVPLLLALVVGAIVTPTDPIVATSIVTGPAATRRLPARIRHALSAESGANDGLALAFVALALLVATGAPSLAREWVLVTLIGETGGGVVLGVLFGTAAGRLLRISEKHGMEEASFLSFTVALALLVLSASELVGVNGVLAVFVAGLSFDNMVGGSERAEEANVQEAVNQFFTLPIFALIGLLAPVEAWLTLGWGGAGAALSVVLLRRLPGLLALRAALAPVDRPRDALFLGWFGPIGVSAVLYSSTALHRMADERIWAITSLIVCVSIVAHGVTATPFARWYARDARARRPAG
jgi:sodium/hydrogen antiporter